MEILENIIGGDITIKEATGTVFMTWVLKKVNQLNTNSNERSELIMLANAYPGQRIEDSQKLEIVNKMLKAGIKIP